MDLKLCGRSKMGSYKRFLEALKETGVSIVTHAEAAALQGIDSAYICIRHDVDRTFPIAYLMAQLEYQYGIRSTFFLLPPGDYGTSENYYGSILQGKIVFKTDFLASVKEIAIMQHEIGLHNDFIQLSLSTGRDVGDLITEQIEGFESAGVRIVGTSSHGSRFARENCFVNYDIFRECTRKGLGESFRVKNKEFPRLTLSEFGLVYEAYSIEKDIYISDSNSRITVTLFDELKTEVSRAEIDELDVSLLKNYLTKHKRLIFLFHPDWWSETN